MLLSDHTHSQDPAVPLVPMLRVGMQGLLSDRTHSQDPAVSLVSYQVHNLQRIH